MRKTLAKTLGIRVSGDSNIKKRKDKNIMSFSVPGVAITHPYMSRQSRQWWD